MLPTGWVDLVRHFFRSYFDLGFLSDSGAEGFTRVVIGAIAGIVALGLFLARILGAKYASLARQPQGPEVSRLVLFGDEILTLAVPMIVVAFVTILVARSIFPSETDYRILTPLPITRGHIFGAKLTALILFVSLFVAAVTLSTSPLFVLGSSSASPAAPVWRMIAHGGAAVLASVFGAGAVIALVAVVLLSVPRQVVQIGLGVLQTGVICALILALSATFQLPAAMPFLDANRAWLYAIPPAWFLGIERVVLGDADPSFTGLARTAMAALVAVAACVAGGYALLYRNFDRVLLRPHSRRVLRKWRPTSSLFARRRDRPTRAAVTDFVAQTLRRSALHRGVFLGTAACGLGVALVLLLPAGLVRWLVEGGTPQRPLINALLFAPFALIFATSMGLRAALLLPMDRRANWIFRMAELEETRAEQLDSVSTTFRWVGVAAPLALVLPLHWLWLRGEAVVSIAVAALWGVVLTELVLANWNRIPFTCPYVPGKEFLGRVALRAFTYCSLFMLVGGALVGLSTTGPRVAAVIITVLAAIAWRLRSQRLQSWGKLPLIFDEDVPDSPTGVRLGAE